jgi:hypothetical protein
MSRERRQAGTCVWRGCRRPVATTNRLYCDEHRVRMSEINVAYQARKHERGICTKCDRPVVTRWHCEEHRRYQNAKQAEYNRRRRALVGPNRASR